MMIDAILAITLAWIATYLIHSTVLLGGTWMIARFGRVGEHAQELLWKLALIGGVITATGQFVMRPYTHAPRFAALQVPVHATLADNQSPLAALWNRLHWIPDQPARDDAHASADRARIAGAASPSPPATPARTASPMAAVETNFI